MRYSQLSLFIILITVTIFAQNRYVYVMDKQYDKLHRTYLLDGSDLTKSNLFTYNTFLKGDAIYKSNLISPFLQNENKLSETISFENIQYTGKHKINTPIYLTDEIIAFVNNKTGELNLIDKENSDTNKVLLKSKFAKSPYSKPQTISINNKGRRAYFATEGKLFRAKILSGKIKSVEQICKNYTTVTSVVSYGNNTIIVTNNGKLHRVTYEHDRVVWQSEIKLKGKDLLEETKIKGVWLNPVDPSTAVLIAAGMRGGVPLEYLCLGTIDLTYREINLSIIKPQKFLKEKCIITCKWSPDGQNIASVISLKEHVDVKGIAQLAILPFDISNKTVSPPITKPKKVKLKFNSDLVWSPDGHLLFAVSKINSKDKLLCVNRTLEEISNISLKDQNNKSLNNISGINSNFSKGENGKFTFKLVSTGRVNGKSFLSESTFPINFKFTDESYSNVAVFNSNMASVDEVIKFEKILKDKQNPSSVGELNVINSLKEIPVSIDSKKLQLAINTYCNSFADRLIPQSKEFNIEEFSKLTFEDAIKGDDKERLLSEKSENDLQSFRKNRISIIKGILDFENELKFVKMYPVSSCLNMDSITEVLEDDISKKIIDGKSFYSVTQKLYDLKSTLKSSYKTYSLFDDYTANYNSISETIDVIAKSNSDTAGIVRTYIDYLHEWDSITVNKKNDINVILASSIKNRLTTDTITLKTINKNLQEYSALEKPDYFKGVERAYALNGNEGINKYFRLNKKVFIPTTAGAALFGAASIGFSLLGRENYRLYSLENESASQIEDYKKSSNQNYVASYMAGGFSAALFTFSSYYLTKHIIKKSKIKRYKEKKTLTNSIAWSEK